MNEITGLPFALADADGEGLGLGLLGWHASNSPRTRRPRTHGGGVAEVHRCLDPLRCAWVVLAGPVGRKRKMRAIESDAASGAKAKSCRPTLVSGGSASSALPETSSFPREVYRRLLSWKLVSGSCATGGQDAEGGEVVADFFDVGQGSKTAVATPTA